MATAVVSIICIAMIVVGGMSLSQGILTSADSTALSVEGIALREGEIMRTDLVGVDASLPSYDTLLATFENNGQVKLASFDRWDFIVEYYDDSDSFNVNWLPYVEGSPAENQWYKTGISLNGGPEAFEPDILNPEEQLDLGAILEPIAGYRAIKMTIVTPNGIAPTLVCGPPTLTAHTETVTLVGIDYFMLKGWTPADGSAVTETTDRIGNRVTGRWLLHDDNDDSRYARHLFPLSNVNEISASTWTVRYRGRAYGWVSGTWWNASLNIDVIIRRADGTIREVIDTEVAAASFYTRNFWINISASYSFPGYTVVDNTDYLEIAYYGVSDFPGPSGSSYIRLRVDDGSLPETSQTRIQGIEWS